MGMNVVFQDAGGGSLSLEKDRKTQARAPVKVIQPKKVSFDAQKTISHIEKLSLAFNRRLQFVVDNKSDQITVKVIDKNTNKVIKVLPPEELRRLGKNLEETLGILFDTKV